MIIRKCIYDKWDDGGAGSIDVLNLGTVIRLWIIYDFIGLNHSTSINLAYLVYFYRMKQHQFVLA